MRTRTILSAATMALTLLASIISATPAAAAPTVVTDRAGDGHGPGDVRALRYLLVDDFVELQLRTNRPLNLANAPAWRGASASLIRFNIDTTAETGVDATVYVRPGKTGPETSYQSFAVHPTPRAPCQSDVSQPQPTLIRVYLNRGCLPPLDYVRVFARYRLDQGGNGTVDSDDRAPNFGYGPKRLIAH
jgi:hypothetical protein